MESTNRFNYASDGAVLCVCVRVYLCVVCSSYFVARVLCQFELAMRPRCVPHTTELSKNLQKTFSMTILGLVIVL